MMYDLHWAISTEIQCLQTSASDVQVYYVLFLRNCGFQMKYYFKRSVTEGRVNRR